MRYFWNTWWEGESEKIAILKQVPLFAHLNQKDLKSIAASARLIEYKKGSVLYKQGEPSTTFFVVATGRITLHQTQGKGIHKVINVLHGGEFFGELSLLTDRPHTVSATAKNDALLLEIEKADFERLTRQIGAIGLYFSRFLSARLHGADAGTEPTRQSKLVSVYSAVPGMGKTTLSINLAAALAREETAEVILIDLTKKPGELAALLQCPKNKWVVETNAGQVSHGDQIKKRAFRHRAGFSIARVVGSEGKNISPKAIAPLFSALTKQYNYIVIDLGHQFDEETQEALHQSDNVFIITGPRHSMLQKTGAICERLKKMTPGQETKRKIVLNPLGLRDTTTLDQKETVLGSKIALSLPNTPIAKSYTESTGLPYVVASPRAGYSRVVRRIARQIRDSIMGLALGSGAALGLAHIGILKVFEREDIPIDIISGSSIGALIGALWTSGKTADEIEDMAHDMTRWRILGLVDPDFPVRAIVRGDSLTRYLKKHLKGKSFADTLVPLRITAVDLYSRQQVVINEGPLYEAVRASVSIPGILAPARRGKDFLTDGGLLAPCPVTILARENVKKIVAVNVLPSPDDMIRQQKYLSDLYREQKEKAMRSDLLVRARWYMGQLTRKIMRPNIAEVILNSMQTMEYELAERSCEDADVVLKPIQHGVHVLNFNEAQKLIARGEEEALKHIDQIKELVKS